MNLAAIASLGNSALATVLSTADGVLSWVAFAAMILRLNTVQGSHHRYLAITVVKTCLPLMFAADTFFVVVFFAEGNWFQLGGSILNWLFEIWWWKDIEDEDSWWSGRGRKIRQWFRKTFTASSPAASGA